MELKEALRLSPTSGPAHRELCNASVVAGDFKSAIESGRIRAVRTSASTLSQRSCWGMRSGSRDNSRRAKRYWHAACKSTRKTRRLISIMAAC